MSYVPAPNNGLSGSLHIPASKSELQRLVLVGCLADSPVVIEGRNVSEDVEAALGAAASLGAIVTHDDATIQVSRGTPPSHIDFTAGESATLLRLGLPVAAALAPKVTARGTGTLVTRPQGALVAALESFGVTVAGNNGRVPLTTGNHLQARTGTVDGSAGSQPVSGLLVALPTLDGDSVLTINDGTSLPYLDLTESVLKACGVHLTRDGWSRVEIRGGQHYSGGTYRAQGDWSSAAFWFSAAALNGEITIHGLDLETPQGDRVALDILEDAGLRVQRETSGIHVAAGERRPLDIDLTDAPDLFPPLVAYAMFAGGTSTFRGLRRLASKESDRGVALAEELGKLGAVIGLDGDLMTVSGGGPVSGDVHIDPRGDHRMAMAAAVAAVGAKTNLHITNAECVAKSYSTFFDDLRALREHNEE